MLLCPLEDRIQPTVAAQPGEGALHHPANSGWKEFSIPAAGDRFDGDAERLGNPGQPLAAVAKITQSWSPEALAGQLAQHWDDALGVMRVGRRDIDPQRDAVLVDLDLDAADLLAAVDAAREAARCRAAGAAVDHHSARVRPIAASQSPGAAPPVEQPAPQPEPGPAGKERVQRAERDVAEQPNRPPLHAAEPDAPNRHDRLAQRCSRPRRLRPGAGWPSAICRHPLKFHQHLVNEGLDVTESIPRGRRGLGGSDGGAHMRLIRWLLRGPQTEPIALPHVSPPFTSK